MAFYKRLVELVSRNKQVKLFYACHKHKGCLNRKINGYNFIDDESITDSETYWCDWCAEFGVD